MHCTLNLQFVRTSSNKCLEIIIGGSVGYHEQSQTTAISIRVHTLDEFFLKYYFLFQQISSRHASRAINALTNV